MFMVCLSTLLFVLCALYADAKDDDANKYCDSSLRSCSIDREVTVFTIATKINDPLSHFLRSAKLHNFNVEVLGLGQQIISGKDKINLLKDAMKNHKLNENLVLFLDGYTTVFNNNKEALLENYQLLGSGVIFGVKPIYKSLETSQVLSSLFPNREKQLNSDTFMGPASTIYKMLETQHVTEVDDDNDQQFYRNIFGNQKLREEFDIKLDEQSAIFFNLNGSPDEFDLEFTEETGFLLLKGTSVRPVVVRGGSPLYIMFNSLTNYLDQNWTPERGCQHCKENTIQLNTLEEYPVIQLSVFVDQPMPFLDVYFERVASLAYPKSRMHVTIYISVTAVHQRRTGEMFNITYGNQYRSVTWLGQGGFMEQAASRNHAFAKCLATEECEFLFAVDGASHLTDPNVLKHLVSMNRSIISPLLSRRGMLWSNFWGDISPEGYYQRSIDYIDIVEGRKRGIWNVPHLIHAYLISRPTVKALSETKFVNYQNLYPDISQTLRDKNIFMTVDNQNYYGYLISYHNHTKHHFHNDLWEIFDNPLDWEEQYIDRDFFAISAPNVKMSEVNQPCPDVFSLPLMSPKFCRDMVEEMENYGRWSSGSNVDPRLDGGYENVPTRDIHIRQIEWEEHWMKVLDKYVYQMQLKLYEGYYQRPRARLSFVVRYRPDEQPALEPHGDASAYTVLITLNKKHADFEGGGTGFLRYNCSILEPKVGWASVHPGRVTHNHEGYRVTEGVRYIFVTFVNP